ncbi:MAG TPA: recombinase family protein, partial [Phycisphaerae bacterium]|nr:recombinase family protein [Phycisphaerae bacterium]
PELQKILRMVDRREIDAVIVYSLDRLTRNIEHLCELIRRMNKAKVSLISVTESLDTKTATGRLMVRLIGELSQWQREYISERTSETMRAAQAAGLRMGNPNKVPYGWTVDPKDPKRIIPDQDERDILEIMIARHKEGASYGEIAEELNADDLLNRAGGEWSRATIYKILKRELGHKN